MGEQTHSDGSEVHRTCDPDRFRACPKKSRAQHCSTGAVGLRNPSGSLDDTSFLKTLLVWSTNVVLTLRGHGDDPAASSDWQPTCTGRCDKAMDHEENIFASDIVEFNEAHGTITANA